MFTRNNSLGERLGLYVGRVIAPLTGVGASLRRSRLFHPKGKVYRVTIEPNVLDFREVGMQKLAERITGQGVARLSNAWWKNRPDLLDVLGFAIRFTDPENQDLLFATIRHPLTTLLAPLSTNQHCFFANDFYAVSPFFIEGVGMAKLRLRRPIRPEDMSFTLELQRLDEFRRKWRSLAIVRVNERLAIPQNKLRFDPFRAGRGIHPYGFVHFIRKGAYAASQRVQENN